MAEAEICDNNHVDRIQKEIYFILVPFRKQLHQIQIKCGEKLGLSLTIKFTKNTINLSYF